MNEKKDTTALRRLARAPEKKTESFTPKIKPLRGGILQQYKRCGRSNCKCIKGSLHGPYTYIVWMKRGRRYKKYVKKSEVELINARILAYKQQREETRDAFRSFGGLLRTLRIEARIQRAKIREMMKQGEQ